MLTKPPSELTEGISTGMNGMNAFEKLLCFSVYFLTDENARKRRAKSDLFSEIECHSFIQLIIEHLPR